MKQEILTDTMKIPEGCTFTHNKKEMIIRGPKGEITRKLPDKKIILETKNDELILTYKNASKREKRMIFTTRSHLRNMFKGVQEGFIYKLKICSGHFPMNVSLKNNVLEIKNFIGEKVPRTLTIKQGADVKINGDEIIVESINKEIAGQTAGSIEKLTKRPGFDKRIFQDGIYITEKDGKKLS
ncbi:50S ribosomal protein L6 [Candidatus Woesearchaeota archaeon]|nr:50S ribosomal protein L6 [Candidatus Woesearchaeota archaeon]